MRRSVSVEGNDQQDMRKKQRGRWWQWMSFDVKFVRVHTLWIQGVADAMRDCERIHSLQDNDGIHSNHCEVVNMIGFDGDCRTTWTLWKKLELVTWWWRVIWKIGSKGLERERKSPTKLGKKTPWSRSCCENIGEAACVSGSTSGHTQGDKWRVPWRA